MMPILGGLLEYTGLHATLLIGGPTPAFNGKIRVHSLSVGTNHGATPASFPEADPEGFRQVRAIFAAYLQTAFSTPSPSPSCYML